MAKWRDHLAGSLLVLVNICIRLTMQDQFEVHTVNQCYGKAIPVVCDPGYMVRVVHAYYRQSEDCSQGFYSNYCMREEPGNPACVGNTTCVFTTPWVYLSADCGYSNNFLVVYQCIPGNLQNNICSTETLSSQSGFLTSANYPLKYPTSQTCETRVTVTTGLSIRFYLLDVYLTYYNYNVAKKCIDRLSITDGTQKTPFLCSGKQRGLVFTSTENQATVSFTSEDHSFANAKGFWLYYEAFDPKTVTTEKPTPTVTLLNDPTTLLTTTDITTRSQTTTPIDSVATTATTASPTPTTFITTDPSTQTSNTSPFTTEQNVETVTKAELGPTDPVPNINPLRDKNFVDLIFLQDSTPWYLKYATKLKKTTPMGQNKLQMTTEGVTSASTTYKTHIMDHIPQTRPKPTYPTPFITKEPLSFIYRHVTDIPPLLNSLKTSQKPLTTKAIKIPGSKVTRLPAISKVPISQSWPKVQMLIDADHPSLISDILYIRHKSRLHPKTTPFSPDTKTTTLKSDSTLAPHSLPSNRHSAAKKGLLLGLTVPEIGAIAGGGACFVGLMIAVVVTIALHKKQKRKHLKAPKKAMTKKPFTEVILAYESSDSSSSSGSGINNMALNGSKVDAETGEYPSSRDGKTNGTWKSWATGLVPIDETLEDLYTEVKRCDLDPERARHKAKFIKGRSRSKSLDDLLVRSGQGRCVGRGSKDPRSPDMTPMMTSLSLDSLDCSVHSHSNLTNVTGSCYPSSVDSDLDQEFYERLDEMYSDVALAHTRARAQHYEELQQELDSLSIPVTPLSGSPYIRLHRSPNLSHALHGSPIDTPFEMSLLDHEHIDIAL